jgi:hypothetical protein
MLLEGEEKDVLGRLEVGQAVVKLQGRAQSPFMIRIPEFQIVKGVVTDEMLREHMGLPAGVQQASMAADSYKATSSITTSTIPATPQPGMDNLALAFLRDVEAYPESGIAERYKRLGISVRQGQKLKFRLLEAQMIEDHEELTPTGRIRKIRLMEKGQHFVAAFGSNHPAPH